MGKLNTKSIIDFGCGSGGWLGTAYKHYPDTEILGLDGEWVDIKSLLFPHEFFRATDLTQQINPDKKYDLAISLEVAEHIEEQYANVFIHNICSHSDIVLFSAAIPLMGGTHHVNEQWPSYWIKKFKDEGFEVMDCLRPLFWNNKKINACYKQDMMIYVNKNKYENIKNIFGEEGEAQHIYDIVHPDKYIEAKAVNKIINRAWLMKHLPEKLFAFIKKIYLLFGEDKVV